jgi:hypothetical protein
MARSWCVLSTSARAMHASLGDSGPRKLVIRITIYVAPIHDAGACHTRFEHSIGVSYLAGVFIEQLRLRQPELEITDAEVRSIAACCGHGATYRTQQAARCTRRACDVLHAAASM